MSGLGHGFYATANGNTVSGKITGVSPVQFQKQLRLQQARLLLLAGDADAATAGFRVGYGEPSHFNRDYKRHFGEPPMRDVERLRTRESSRSPGEAVAVERPILYARRRTR